jgi:hypothetical protein
LNVHDGNLAAVSERAGSANVHQGNPTAVSQQAGSAKVCICVSEMELRPAVELR